MPPDETATTDPFRSGAALLAAAAPWTVVDDHDGGTPAERLARDHELLAAVRSGRSGSTARVWENGPCLVTTRSDARLPAFARARAALSRDGWPVLARESGGSAVPHAPGVLQLSVVFRPPEGSRCTLEAAYGALCLPLRDALAARGLRASLGAAPGSFCDGRFNLLIDGRKIAGTAQRWRARPGTAEPGRGAVLAHALILVEADLAALVEPVNRFYALAGGERRCRAEASVTLAELGCETDFRATLLSTLRTALPCA